MTATQVLAMRSVITSASRDAQPRYNLTVFPYYRDRLACDPLNYFCVYSYYEFKWNDTVDEAERNVRELVDAMVEAVGQAFNESHRHWKRLPSQVQCAHVLRAVMNMPTAPISPSLITSHVFKDIWGHRGRRGTELDDNASQAGGSIYLSKQMGASSSFSPQRRRSSVSHLSVRTTGKERKEEDLMFNLLTQQWQPPHIGPRCRLVLDIVASRKSLGEDPLSSRPYRLGQRVHQYTKKRYATEVMATFVGISDNNNTLVGRDILYPYRITGGGAASTEMKTMKSGRRPSSMSGFLPMHRRSMADILSSANSGNMPAVLGMLEKMLSGSIPAPRITPLPPSNVEKVDNLRLLVCYPSLEDENDVH
ncbi:hypothetical protein TRVL_01884 [Trypanosoma vivax]|nr:hypothetical protein TRVL_01884 [Trypanosoma vivax]